MFPRNIILFADKLPPSFGGMEMHAQYFIEYFKAHKAYNLIAIISKDENGDDRLITDEQRSTFFLEDYLRTTRWESPIVFFNSGRWIEELKNIRSLLPRALFMYRTGGNEIIKAPLIKHKIPLHKDRQNFWAAQINQNVDVLITNSKYTECRLSEIGINEKLFSRCVGGVDSDYIGSKRDSLKIAGNNVFLCASRFVPYKNHHLLIEVFEHLKNRGYDFTLNLAGDGPLLADIKKMVRASGLENRVVFTGVLSNHQVLSELLKSDFYIQLSSEFEVEVEGGKYLHAEGMGRSILEAISSGTFVISTNTGAIPETVTGDTGALFGSLSVPDITSTIEKLLVNPQKPKPITDRYSWCKYFSLYEKIFSEHETISASN